MDVEEEIAHPAHEHRRFDVTDDAAVADLVAGLDRLDVLVNAAGIILHDRREFSDEGFARVMAVNLAGTQKICYAAEGLLEAAQGTVVNFASMWSFFGSSRNPGYSASKGAVVSFTRALAAGWGPRGMRVNAVAPGWVKTRMATEAMNNPERNAKILDRIPQGRWGDPAEVAEAVAFLASPAASYINGVVLPIDGGFAIA
jgi:NAD(P)-dependent dehydrogenase (short-subunit alcohol dehydrogenase family)